MSFFDSWGDLGRVFVKGMISYIVLVLLLRISGKRTLSKMNSFDLVITISIGSTFATVLLSKDVALLEGAAAFSVLVLMQYVMTWLSVRSGTVKRLVKSEPTLIYHNGCFLFHAMKRERVTEEEVVASVRQDGILSLEDVTAVVLETDGSFSIITGNDPGVSGGLSSLENVRKL